MIYQYWCDACFVPYEIMKDKYRYDTLKLTKKEKLKFRCPECKRQLTYLIAPPKLVKIH